MMDIETALRRVRETHRALEAARRAADRQQRDAQQRRDQAIRQAHAAGASYQDIADILKVHRSYVYQLCRGD